MPVNVIPARHEYGCDACTVVKHSDKPFDNGCPTGWSIVRHLIPSEFKYEEGDWIEGLLCPECTKQVREMLSKFIGTPTGTGAPYGSLSDVIAAGSMTDKLASDPKPEPVKHPITYQEGGKPVTKMMTNDEIQHARFMGGVGDEVWD